MGHKPDDIKGGGQGSIKVGATGRVSALMTRELESVSCGVSASSNEAGTGSNTVQRTQGSSIQGKMHSYRIPMLASEDISVDKTSPVRGKLENKRSKLVEIVDLKCGRRKPGGKVCSTPISKKLTFSRLSVSN